MWSIFSAQLERSSEGLARRFMFVRYGHAVAYKQKRSWGHELHQESGVTTFSGVSFRETCAKPWDF